MDHFDLRGGELYAEEVPVADIARRHGTPVYVYSRATLTRHYHAFDQALGASDHLVCYAVKANPSLAVLQVLARLGSGFDIVSGGELVRVLKAGGDPRKVVFSGVGKSVAELKQALVMGICCFNVESEPELLRLNELAVALKKRAPVALRVNPDVDAQTHPYISTGLKQNKFGVDVATAERLYLQARALPGIELAGIACHIGSQLQSLAPYLDALDRVLALVDRLRKQGIELKHVDVGGGLGVRYRDEQPPAPADLAAAVQKTLAGRGLKILMEPGRAIAGNAGILVTRVEYLKVTPERSFAVVDAAMNDLLRPALYEAWHQVVPVKAGTAPARTWDVVGPVCESGDWLARERHLPLAQGDLVAIRTAGAYGFAMSSNYNSRPRVAEIMVDGKFVHVVRARESVEDLMQHESLLPDDTTPPPRLRGGV
ncbi:MAG TPA: diaminopimelate decarboxylase [Candidatus Binatia bacterium]|nr:diaminopimelate decarboxylase [Candidatus Binatia bacterium]